MSEIKLNDEQRLAVEHPLNEPACLIAGAGSGKTRVLTERVRWLIDQGAKPRRIVVITFTNKAAGELLSRLGLDDDCSFDAPHVSTIHSLALGFIRSSPHGFGLQDKLSPLDDYNQYQMMKKLIEQKKLTLSADKPVEMPDPKALLETISFHRARGVGFRVDYTEAVAEAAKIMYAGQRNLDELELSLWEAFENEKRSQNGVDFDDMIWLCVRRAEQDAAWLAKLQQKFDYVLQDEAQDTSVVQWRFVNSLLAPDNMNIYTVGDLSQSIMSFNGSSPELLFNFSKEWRGVQPKLYKIARNHRSDQKIVTLANKIQSQMVDVVPLHMESWRGLNGQQGLINKVEGRDAEDIGLTIAQQIFRDRDKTPYSQNAVLFRAGRQLRDLENGMIRYHVPYVVRGGYGLLQTEEIRDILSYFRLAINPKDFTAFERSVQAPRIGVGAKQIEDIRLYAVQKCGGDLIQGCNSSRSIKILDYLRAIKSIQSLKDDPSAALKGLLRAINYVEYIKNKYKQYASKTQDKLKNINDLGGIIQGLQDSEMSLEDIVFQLTTDRRSSEEDDNGKVVLSTIHGAKGLEWDRVYVTNLHEGSLPHKFSMGSAKEIEEERRLFYVAVTRPRNTLVLCFADYDWVYMGEDRKPRRVDLEPSRFLYDIGALAK